MRSETMHALMREMIVWYIRLVRWTSRFEVEGTGERDALHAAGQPFVIALWHNRIAMMPYAWIEETRNLAVLASAHRDGRLVSGGLGRFGISAISVDSRGHASTATRQVIRRLQEGKSIGITPDGPRGPRMRVREGLVHIAVIAGVPIVPVTYSTSRRIVLNSWDRFVLPLPFSRIVCRWGAPIAAPDRRDEAAQKAMRARVERELTALTDACDRAVGVEPTAPAPWPEGES